MFHEPEVTPTMSTVPGNITLIVLAQDRPGELVRILQPLSENGANIHGVFHEHDPSACPGKVPVEIVFTFDQALSEADKERKLEKIKSTLTAQGIIITEISMGVVIKTRHIILVGHVFDTDIRDTIIRLTNTGAKLVDLKATFTSVHAESTVKFTVSYDSDEIETNVLAEVDRLCKDKNLKFITS